MSNATKQLKTIKIAAWNANNVIYKKQELIQFTIEHNTDIILISETWLREANKFKIPNYYTYREDRKTGPGGGVAILIKKTINHELITIDNLQTLESIGLQINLEGTGKTNIFAAYYPPGKTFVENDYKKILDLNFPTIIAGDLNAKHPSWNSRTINNYGRKLQQLTTTNNIQTLAPTDPTFYGPIGRPDVLDMILHKDIPRNITTQTIPELSSDHNPILIEVGYHMHQPNLTTKSRIDWPHFKEHISNSLKLKNLNKSPEELEENCTNFARCITIALEKSTITTTRTVKQNGDIPIRIKTLIREKTNSKKFSREL